LAAKAAALFPPFALTLLLMGTNHQSPI